jgi:predicted metalloprotease with PDZ domain
MRIDVDQRELRWYYAATLALILVLSVRANQRQARSLARLNRALRAEFDATETPLGERDGPPVREVAIVEDDRDDAEDDDG